MPRKQTEPRIVSRSGRFTSGPTEEVTAFTESVSFDERLWRQDIQGSIAHATALQEAGLITKRELKSIADGLRKISTEITSDKFRWKPELEDVHMNIEAELTRRTPAGTKLHAGRSRNDQVATDLRLWLRDEVTSLRRELRELQGSLLRLAESHADVIMPGYTHLQRAQPVSFAHHLLAYVEMLARDFDRLGDCRERLNVCPLGSAAMAGTTLPINRDRVARMLGFVDGRGRPRLTHNSMDAVSDRDFVVEFCAAAALIAVHLSRFAEDLVLWSSSEFGFVRIDDAFTTGSSLMPQKRNPDVAELTRGRSGRVVGNLVALLTVLKGLPMTYNRDLQEDKQPLFDTADTIRSCVRLAAAMTTAIQVDREACEEAAADPALLATDLADDLVRGGVPFRKAHHLVGKLVAFAENSKTPLDQIPPAQLRRIALELGAHTRRVFDLRKAMRRRTATGAPGPRLVRKELLRWRRILDMAQV